MRVTLFSILGLFALSSCQVPSSISLEPSPHSGGTGAGKFKKTILAGLEAPTWGELKLESTIPGWDIPVDDTYTRVSTSQKVIAITFDDGPHGVNTPRLLDMLKERKVKATFFVVGDMIKGNPSSAPGLLRRMVAEGHEIGNHTVTHGTLSRMSDDALRSELTRAHDMILKETGVAPRSMRPPGGAIKSDQKKLMLQEFGYPTILWSVDPEDWKRPGPSVVTSRLLKGASPGGILLVHDLHAPTVDAMPSTLDQLLAQGYRFVTISELIALDERKKE